MSLLIFKPDEIGDFIIATGAIRALAREHGEQNTTLVVKSELVPLARREFPAAEIISLPWQRRRKRRNTTFANMRSCFPAWRTLRARSVDLAVCLRSQRNYLQTILFAAPRAVMRVASENTLLLNNQWRRKFFEAGLRFFKRPILLPYPPPQRGWTSELEAHRSVASASLGRDVAKDEVAPRLFSAHWNGRGDWLLCPFSSQKSKDYRADYWAQAIAEAQASCQVRTVRLAGSPDQAERLADFATVLRGAGVPVAVEPPCPLDGFVDAVAGASLVLTVDTAAAHFACAIDAPAVIVHSGQHAGVYGPYSRTGRQVWLVGDRERLGRERWRESVPPEMVSAAILRALRA